MSDPITPSTDEQNQSKDTQPVQPQEPNPESEGLKNLRTAYEKSQARVKAYEEAEKKAKDEELAKKGEYEKLISQKEAEKKALEEKLTRFENTQKAEKALQSLNVNPEVLDLLTDKVINSIEEGKTIEQIALELKTAKPNLFLGSQPVGNIGLGNSTTQGTKLSDLEKATDNSSLSEYINQINKN